MRFQVVISGPRRDVVQGSRPGVTGPQTAHAPLKNTAPECTTKGPAMTWLVMPRTYKTLCLIVAHDFIFQDSKSPS